MKRSYKQNCALAYAMDLVGERWSLLIVRELLVEPRRYSELLDNLVGIGTNLLAKRLKEMELAGLVERDGAGYALTKSGLRLQPVIWELVKFGLSLGISDDPQRLTRTEWDAVAIRALFDEKRGQDLSGCYVIVLNGKPFCFDKHRASVSVTAGACDDFLARVSMSKTTAGSLGDGTLSYAGAIKSGALVVDGSRREAKQLLGALGLSA